MSGWGAAVVSVIGYDGMHDGIEAAEYLGIIAEGQRLGLSRVQTLTVYFYTAGTRNGDSIFAKVNAALRMDAGRATPTIAAEWADFASILTSAIDVLPPYQGTVYRRLQPPQPIDRLKAGETEYYEAGFLSASLAPDVFPGRDILVLRTTSGKPIWMLSQFPAEQEVVFRPGSHFRVLDIINDSDSTIVVLEE